MSTPPSQPTGIDRRTLLARTAAAGIAGAAAINAYAQDKPAAKLAPAPSPNLAPPIITLKSGKLRGLREGKTLSFLGIKYADAERFGQPKPVQPWDGIKNAQVWGACCPSPISETVSFDEIVFPHRYWPANENCQYLNVWTQNPTPPPRSPSWSGCTAAASPTAPLTRSFRAPLDGEGYARLPIKVTAAAPANSATSLSSA